MLCGCGSGKRSIGGAVARGLLVLLPVACCLASSGCGASGGQIAYWLGIGRGKKLPAQFEIPSGKVLVLVDDPNVLVRKPNVREKLASNVGKELLKHEAVENTIDPSVLLKLRQAETKYESMSARQIGEKVGADIVLWLQVREFFAPKDVQDISTAAKLSVSIKVLQVQPEDVRSKVRLWPTERSGHMEEAELSSNERHKLKTESRSTDELTEKLARKIARLFYEHTLGELDDDR